MTAVTCSWQTPDKKLMIPGIKPWQRYAGIIAVLKNN